MFTLNLCHAHHYCLVFSGVSLANLRVFYCLEVMLCSSMSVCLTYFAFRVFFDVHMSCLFLHNSTLKTALPLQYRHFRSEVGLFYLQIAFCLGFTLYADDIKGCLYVPQITNMLSTYCK